jgi:hypothetical protein
MLFNHITILKKEVNKNVFKIFFYNFDINKKNTLRAFLFFVYAKKF